MYPRTAVHGLLAICLATVACDHSPTRGHDPDPPPDPMEVFRYETFGDETWWTDTLAMNEVIQAAVDPETALGVGLKVDADALPEGLLASADLSDPATTVELIRLDAVVGLRGEVDDEGNLTRVGVTCALCHSTVDNSVMSGIGHRLDGWPNLDLNPGLIVSLSPYFADPAAQSVLTSWGPGMFDPRFNVDGISDPVVIPPAYGLDGVALETYTGDGSVSYWNAYVAITQMHGHGDFSDPRIGVSVDWDEDLVTPLLEPLLEYQLSLDGVCSRPPGAPFAIAARFSRTLPSDSTHPRRPAWIRPWLSEPPRGCIAQPLSARSGSTHRTSTTEARRPSMRWWITTSPAWIWA